MFRYIVERWRKQMCNKKYVQASASTNISYDLAVTHASLKHSDTEAR